jgi:tetratricopeptide (TPR) repeat protein
MIRPNRVAYFLLIACLAGCAAYQIGGQVERGRRALLVNDPESALPYFVDAAKGDPNYVYVYDLFRESVWTYLGRSQYETKRYAEARQSLERALAFDKDEHLARLYLGLTLTRLGDSANGEREIQTALKGVHDWLDYTERTRPFEAYWDPAREIRKTSARYFSGSPGSDFRLDDVIADAEWVGKRLEEEVDKVRRDRRQDLDRNFEMSRGRGFGVGIGVGF